jgi:hypothetical protein
MIFNDAPSRDPVRDCSRDVCSALKLRVRAGPDAKSLRIVHARRQSDWRVEIDPGLFPGSVFILLIVQRPTSAFMTLLLAHAGFSTTW